MTAPVRCAPPENKPTVVERDLCASWFDSELDILQPTALLALGDFAYRAIWRYLGDRDYGMPKPRPRFAHGLEVAVPSGPVVIASFHPSQQNTFTGRLTEAMLDAVFSRTRTLVAAA